LLIGAKDSECFWEKNGIFLYISSEQYVFSEANFNWWNKLIFAKRMVQQAIKEGSIPQECYAKKRSHCNFVVLTKQFFCSSSRVLCRPAGLGECNFGDCYN
jgi:hypothetical protein